MSAKDKYHQSVSKTVKVTCRVESCKEQVLTQNYERHLRRYHPQEDPKSLRTYGQKRISFFQNNSQSAKKDSPEEVAGSKVTTYTEDVNKNLTISHESELEIVQTEQVDSHLLSSSQGGDCLVKDSSNVEGDIANFTDQEVELLKISQSMVGTSSQPVSSNSQEVVFMKGDQCPQEKRSIKRPRMEDVEESNDIKLCEIEAKVDNILAKLDLHLGDQTVKLSQESRVMLKLDFISSNINLSNTVKDLQTVVKEVQKMSVSEEREDVSLSSQDHVKLVLQSCRSVSEIETKVPEFRYDENSEKVVCQVCKQAFKYDASLEQGRKQSPSLSHLKDHLKNHLDNSATHKAALENSDAKDKLEKKEEARNQKIGLTLGRTAFYLLSNGRPCSDFTQLLSMQHSNGADIGDINHSTDFISNMAQSFSKAITSRIKEHLSTRLPQTGCLPPCKVVEDGATYRHDTRQLVGLTTIFPGDKPLLQSVFCGAPKGIRSDGASTAKSMATEIAEYIVPQQYLGTSADGANFLAHVGELLDKELGKKGHHDWDGAHAAATIEAELRNPKKTWAQKFAWLNEIITTISKANRFHNWGIEWDRFYKTCQALVEEGYDIKCKVPKFLVPHVLPTMLSRSTLDSGMG